MLHIHAHIHTYTHTHTQTHTQTRTHTDTHTHTQTHKHSRAHMYAYRHICTDRRTHYELSITRTGSHKCLHIRPQSMKILLQKRTEKCNAQLNIQETPSLAHTYELVRSLSRKHTTHTHTHTHTHAHTHTHTTH